MKEIDAFLQQRVIYETIVTTIDKENKPNAAPMGIYIDNDNFIIIKPFLESKTFENLWEQEKCVINISNDPRLFVLSALFKDELSEDSFISDKEFDIPILRQCKDSYFLVSVVQKDKELQKGYFKCKIKKKKLQPVNIFVFTRAFSLLLEILIHSTRIIEFRKVGNSIEVDKLTKLVKEHASVIRRIPPQNSEYIILLEKILAKLSL